MYSSQSANNLLLQSCVDTKYLHRAVAIDGYATTKVSMGFDTRLRWNTQPSKIAIMKKSKDTQCTKDLIMICEWLLTNNENITIFVEDSTFNELQKIDSSFTQKLKKIPDMNNFGDGIDLILVIGGDGTLLYLVSLFQERRTVPPIACFQRGSFNFLCPFNIAKYKEVITDLLDAKKQQTICVRMRLTARLWKHPNNFHKIENRAMSGVYYALYDVYIFVHKMCTLLFSNEVRNIDETKEVVNDNSLEFDVQSMKIKHNKHQDEDQSSGCSTPTSHGTIVRSKSAKNCNTRKKKMLEYLKKNFDIVDDLDVAFRKTSTVFPEYKCFGYISHALNEVLVHAESGASLMQADLYVDGTYCTTVQADGMIFSTPTGSTAYNISAGGSLISPTVPCIAMTPICPHTLSFRPVVVPDSTIIHLKVSENARFCADLSCDGRNPVKVERGDVVEIVRCPYPVPTFKSDKFNAEWFGGLVKKFNWNVREIQKPIENAS